jgi:hypothetical protein
LLKQPLPRSSDDGDLSVIKISSRRFLGVDKNEFRHPVRSLDT